METEEAWITHGWIWRTPEGSQESIYLLRQHLEVPESRRVPLPCTQPGPYKLVRHLHLEKGWDQHPQTTWYRPGSRLYSLS